MTRLRCRTRPRVVSCERKREFEVLQRHEGELVDDESAACGKVAVVASVSAGERHWVEACTGYGKIAGCVDGVREGRQAVTGGILGCKSVLSVTVHVGFDVIDRIEEANSFGSGGVGAVCSVTQTQFRVEGHMFIEQNERNRL
jgi:hypothetical protein